MNLTKTGNFSKVLRLRKGIAMLLHKIAIALFWAALVSVAFKAKAAPNDDIYEMPVEETFYENGNCHSGVFMETIRVSRESRRLSTTIVGVSIRTRCNTNGICTVLVPIRNHPEAQLLYSYEISDTMIHGIITFYDHNKPICYAILQSL
jgi:hypothetical protein